MSAAETTPGDPLVLVLVGPMGSGKTSVGRRVARELAVPFIDTDKVVAREHGPIPQIFAEHGEEAFRRWERAAVEQAIASGGVISLGGGAVVTAETRALLKTVSVAALTVSPEAVAERIADTNRPLLAGENPVERWKNIYQARRAWYEEVADATFDTSRIPMQKVAATVVAWMRGRK